MRTRLVLASACLAVSMIGLAGCQAVGDTGDTGGSGDSADSGTDSGGGTDAGSGCADPVLVDGPATGGTISITSTGMDPATVTVSVGDTVGFTSGDGGNHGLVVGALSSVTVANGLDEFYRFDGAGVCDVADEIGTGTATISVQ
jgi:plastocyanin